MAAETKITPKLFGPISQEEASVLFWADRDFSAAEDILSRLGSTGAREDVALVTIRHANDVEMPSHFITIRRDDIGTTLISHLCDVELPQLDEAYLQLTTGLANNEVV